MLGIRVKIYRHIIRKAKLGMKMHRHRFVVIVGSVGLGLFWGLAMKADIFSSPQNISNNAEGSSSASIAVDNVNIFLAWRDNRDILFSKSTDGGTTWSTPQNISNTPGFSANPAIATDGRSIFIVWSDTGSGTGILFAKSDDGGDTWSTPQSINNGIESSAVPVMTTDGTNIFIAWEEQEEDVFFAKSTDGGTTWSPPQEISNSIRNSVDPAITTDGTNIFIAWWGDDPQAIFAEILFSKSIDGGNTWSSPQNISNSEMTSRAPSITTNGTDIFLSWNDTFQFFDPPFNVFTEILFSKSVDGGTTWSTPQNISNNEESSEDSSIVTNGTSISITWMDDSSGNEEIYFSKSDDGGTTWTPGRNISGNSRRDVNPISATDGTNLFFSWENTSEESNDEIIFARTGVVDTFSPVITLNGAPTIILQVRVDTYIEAGATLTDNDTDYTETVTIGGDAVDTTTIGTYTVTYDASGDAAGNTVEQVTRTVQVLDVPSGRTIFDRVSCEIADGVWTAPNKCSFFDFQIPVGESLTISSDIVLFVQAVPINSGTIVNFGTINFLFSDFTNSGTIENSGIINFSNFNFGVDCGGFPCFFFENSGIINNPGTINNICGGFSGSPPASGNPVIEDCSITINDRNSCELATGVWTAPNTCSTGLVLSIGETLTIENGINFNGGISGFGSININAGGTFTSDNIDIGSSGGINNSGVFNNTGTIVTDFAFIDNAGTFNNSGTMDIVDGLIHNSAIFNNFDTISLCCFGSFLNTGIFQNLGTVSNPLDGAIVNSGTFNNSGTIEVSPFTGENPNGEVSFDNTDGTFNNACTGNIIGTLPSTGDSVIQLPCDVTTPPVITLIGDAITTLKAGIDPYTEAGATVMDNIDSPPFPVIIGGDSVDVNTVGTYIVTYDATDSAGNPAIQVIRTVNVVPTTPTPGDLDGDFDVDLDDLDIILDARNTPADGVEDLRDLDGDGVITGLDARIGVLSCTRPRCSNQ